MTGEERIVEAVITRLGAQGDGIGALPDGMTLYVAKAAPGDRVRAVLEGAEGDGLRGRLVEVLEAGAFRAAPPCPQFGTCGGCALQHLSDDTYREWKRGLVVDALARNGVIADEIADLLVVERGSRRRGTFFVEKINGAVRAGFHVRGSHRITSLDGCVVLAPQLLALVDMLPAGLAEILAEGERAEIIANLLDSGIDALIRLPRLPDQVTRERLVAFATAANLVRLSVAKSGSRDRSAYAEPVVTRRPAQVSFGGVRVAVPPGAFLQASAEAEAAMVTELRAAIGEAKATADLFAGAGTFTFALAKQARVHAVEADAGLVAALKSAAAKSSLGVHVSADTRDLFKRPLLADELNRFDAVMFDPPRVGAKEQAAMLARSKVARVVAVSCNPHTFARDARLLQDGGYELVRVVPIDQFLWTSHLEVVGTFVRG